MEILEILTTVIINGAIALGPFAALLLLNRKPRQIYLISIIISLSLIVSHSYFVGAVIGRFIETPYIISEPFIFLISPLLYFYFLYIATNHTRHKWIDLLHLLPFILFFASFVPIYLHGQNTEYFSFLYSNKNIMTGFLWIMVVTQFIYYYIKIHRLNTIYKAKLVQQHSNYLKYDASWVRLFLILFLVILAFITLVLFIFIHYGGFKHFTSTVAMFFSLQVYFVAYKGLNQKTIALFNQEETRDLKTEPKKNNEATSGNNNQASVDKLQNYMQNQKPYLNPELTLVELAEQVKMSRNELSALINNDINSNFYLYVNRFRVEHVKLQMQQDSNKQFTILALAYESGFNSKSTFNTIFKKLTGLTPSEYRNTLD